MCSKAYKLFINFKTALYSSALEIQLTIVESCFKPKLLLSSQRLAFFKIRHNAFAHSPFNWSTLSFGQSFCALRHLSLLWQAFTTCCINKTMPIHFIDGRCHIKQLKAGKSYKTCLTNHTQSIITPYHATGY